MYEYTMTPTYISKNVLYTLCTIKYIFITKLQN